MHSKNYENDRGQLINVSLSSVVSKVSSDIQSVGTALRTALRVS